MPEYEKQTWSNGPGTPLSAQRLNHLETQADRAVETVADQVADPDSPIGTQLSTAIADQLGTSVQDAEAAAAAAIAAVDSIPETLDTEDAAIAALVGTPSVTRGALDGSFLGLIQSPINALQRGLTPANTAADNFTKLSELAAESKADKREVYFRGTDEDTLISAPVSVGGAILTGAGDASRLRMAATTGLRLLNVDAPDTVISGMYLSSAGVRNTAWATSGGNNAAIYVGAGMHDVLVEDVAGDSWTTLVHAPGDTGVATRRLRARRLRATNVGFIVNGRGLIDFEIADISGSISFDRTDKTSAPPHHVYLAYASGIPWNEGGRISGVIGWDSPGSSAAVKVDHWRGGEIDGIVLRNCSGLLTIDSCEDVTARGVYAKADGLSGTPAIYVTQTDAAAPSKRIIIEDFLVEFASGDHAVGVHIDRGSGSKVRRGRVVTNRLTTTSNGAIRSDQNDTEFSDIEIATLGSFRTNAGIYLSQTTAAKARRIKAQGVVTGVQLIGAVETLVEYEPSEMVLTSHNSAAAVAQDAATTGTRITVPTLPPINDVAPLAWFDATRRGGIPGSEVPLSVVQSGQTMSALGTWRYAANGVYNQNNVSTAAAWLDTLTADHRVETLAVLGGVAVGVSARVTDNDNRLYAEVTTSGVALFKRVAGVATQLATGGPTVGKVGRKYRIGIAVCDNLVQVFLDGQQVIMHALAGGDETTFAGKTLAGLHSRSAATARFISAQWFALL
jgi:hypothetical protein